MVEDISGIAHIGGGRARQVCTTTHSAPHPIYRDRLHRDWVAIGPGSTYAFPELRGPGCVTCIWVTLLPGVFETVWKAIRGGMAWDVLRYSRLECLRTTWLHITYDGEKTPRVSAPLGQFFGTGFGAYRHFHSAYIGMTSGGYYCYFPMPFARSCRVEVENRDPREGVTFYGAVTYTQQERPPEGTGLFHASFRHEPETTPGSPYVILDARGRGRYAGCSVSMEGKRMRKHFLFMEGNLKIYADGETEPSLEYTGTEDYFMGGWYFNKGPFHTPTHGVTLKSWRRFRISAYRFHTRDPIPFASSIRVILHHGEFDEVPAEYSSVAYWYQAR